MDKEQFKIIDKIPFDKKNEAAENGASAVLGEDGKAVWRISSDVDESEFLSSLNAKIEIEDSFVEVKEEPISPVSFEFDSTLSLGDYQWDKLFAEWNSLDAVNAIKTCGLPQREDQRADLIFNLSQLSPGKQFKVGYEDLCEYCPVFEKAYGLPVLSKALNYIGSENVFNFSTSVYESDLPIDIKRALIYAFPISRPQRELEIEMER